MIKKITLIFFIAFVSVSFIFSQDEFDEFSDEALFGESTTLDEEDLFGSSDEDLFFDDGIEVIEDTSSKTDSSKGILFENGSIKVGGSFRTGLNTNTVLYNPNQNDFWKNIKDTTLTPSLSAFLSVDARPSENLRMYTKFGLNYPFTVSAKTTLYGHSKFLDKDVPENMWSELEKIPLPPTFMDKDNIKATYAKTSVKDWFTLKELFTDFSIKDTAFFRFGVHTVSWGTGYFFSPVSDMINTSSIDPENPTEQVNGSLNLRTQFIFPGTQNCLWTYIIPSTNFKEDSIETYAKDTALAVKGDFVLGGWEIGAGAFWKYENAPKIMTTLTGSIKKISLFGEAVYQYGGSEEWAANKKWNDKTSIFQVTLGGFYTWKDPSIMLAMQYYFDSNDVDLSNRLFTNGHNIAMMVNFSKLFDVKQLSMSVFSIVNFGRKGITDKDAKKFGLPVDIIKNIDLGELFPCFTLNALLAYSPVDDIKLSIGPEIIFTSFDKKPTVSLKIGATLGGGKF